MIIPYCYKNTNNFFFVGFLFIKEFINDRDPNGISIEQQTNNTQGKVVQHEYI